MYSSRDGSTNRTKRPAGTRPTTRHRHPQVHRLGHQGEATAGDHRLGCTQVVDEALQLHGGYGYFNDYDIERFYRAAKVLEIYEGTKEIEKIIISREVLGKL